jgi:hypothetical protein
MAIETIIYNDGDYVVSRAYDLLEGHELSDMLFSLIDKSQKGILKHGYMFMFDLRDIDNFKIDRSDISRIFQINLAYGQDRGNTKTAMLLGSESGRELAELHKTLSIASNIPVEIFKSQQAAYDWLGIDPDTITEL